MRARDELRLAIWRRVVVQTRHSVSLYALRVNTGVRSGHMHVRLLSKLSASGGLAAALTRGQGVPAATGPHFFHPSRSHLLSHDGGVHARRHAHTCRSVLLRFTMATKRGSALRCQGIKKSAQTFQEGMNIEEKHLRTQTFQFNRDQSLD